MGSSSMSTNRELIHWQGLLLLVSLLNFWSQPTTAQVTVVSMDALEGSDVTLNIHYWVRSPKLFLWYRGLQTDIKNNIAYLFLNQGSSIRGAPDGQFRVQDDGSLLIKNVTLEHTGVYTIIIELEGCQKMKACGVLNVYPIVGVPTLLASKTSVTENKDAVVFICDTEHNRIQWFFEGERLSLTERTKLSLDRRNLTIDPVQRWDAGSYQCKAFNPLSSGKSARLRLNVKYK